MSAQTQYNSLGAIISMMVIGECGTGIALITPGILSALQQMHGLLPGDLAIITAAEMCGIAIAALIAAPFMGVVNRRVLAGTALVVAASANFATAASPASVELIALCRLIAGGGEGLAMLTMVASFAGLRSPDRIFAIEIIANTLVASGFYQVLRALTVADRPATVFVVLGGVMLLACLALFKLPARAPEREPFPSLTTPSTPQQEFAVRIVALGGMLAMFTAIGVVWPLVGSFGEAAGLPADQIASALSIASFVALFSSVIVGIVSTRFGRRVPLLVGLSALAAVMFAIASVTSISWFSVAASAFMFFWLFSIAYYMGFLASIDYRGRIISFGIPMQFAGLAAGPLIATLALELSGDRYAVVAVGITLCLAAALLAVAANTLAQPRSGGIEPALPTVPAKA